MKISNFKKYLKHKVTLYSSVIFLILFLVWSVETYIYFSFKYRVVTLLIILTMIMVYLGVRRYFLWSNVLGVNKNNSEKYQLLPDKLPLIVFYGASDSGKTSLIKNSGLHFPLTEQTMEFGELWFADSALLVEVKEDACQGFVETISRKNNLMVQAITLVINVAQISLVSKEELGKQVNLLRRFVADVYRNLNRTIPVYLIFTHCDILQGFNEYFADLDVNRRSQVWGMELSPSSNFVAKCQNLYVQLANLRLHKITRESNVDKKFLIYQFPDRFYSLVEPLVYFLDLMLSKNAYQETLWLKGAYFTSVQSIVDKSDSYFARELFAKKILGDIDMSAVAGANLRVDRKIIMVITIVFSVLAFVTLCLCCLAYSSNAKQLRQGVNVAQQLVDDFSGPITLQQAAYALQHGFSYYQSLHTYRKHTPWYLRLGFCRAESLQAPIQTMLVDIMQHNFMPALQEALVKHLQTYNQNWQSLDIKQQEKIRGMYYGALKTYLMLNYPRRLIVSDVVPILVNIWQKLMAADALTIDDSNYPGLLMLYLQQINYDALPGQIQAELVNQARSQLYTADNISNLYADFINIWTFKLPALTIENLLHGEHKNLLVSEAELSELFTIKGRDEYAEVAIDTIAETANQGDWVMDAPLSELNNTHWRKKFSADTLKQRATMLAKQLRQHYLIDYNQAWFEFLTSVRVVPFASLDVAVKSLDILAGTKSPIIELLHIAMANMQLPEPSAIKTYTQELTKIQAELQQLSQDANAQHEAQVIAMDVLKNDNSTMHIYKSAVAIKSIFTPITNTAAQNALTTLLLQPVRTAWQVLLNEAVHALEQKWQTSVFNYYQRSLADKFPFNKSATVDVAFTDVNNFFSPKQGILWQFINAELAAFITYTDNGWQKRTWLGEGMDFSSEFLHALTQIKAITDSLYGSESNELGFNYHIYPEPSPRVSRIEFMANGQAYHYDNGPQEWVAMRWPGPAADQQSSLSVVTALGGNLSTEQFSGLWGLFHLLALARLEVIQSDELSASWALQGEGAHNYRITLSFKMDAPADLFLWLLKDSLTLPKQLLDGTAAQGKNIISTESAREKSSEVVLTSHLER